MLAACFFDDKESADMPIPAGRANWKIDTDVQRV